MATNESDAHPKVKEAILQGDDTCTISVPKTAMLGRDLKNEFTEKYLQMRATGAPRKELEEFINQHSQYHALAMGESVEAEIPCGQIAGLIQNVVSAAEVIQNIVNGVPAVLDEIKGKLPT